MSSVLTLPKVDERDPTPKYLQAREILVRAIRGGVLTPGAKLPSTKELSSLIDISLITAHKALEGLVETGWLRREVGRGTYVRDDLDPAHWHETSIGIGLLLDQAVNIDDYYHSTIINRLRREAQMDTRRVDFSFLDRPTPARNRRDIGAIWFHPPLDARLEVERFARQAPLVVLGGTVPDVPAAAVDCDNVSGAKAAIRHLLELGHRRFMVLSGPMVLSNSRDRAVGALDELAAAGLSVSPVDQPISLDSVVLDESTRAQVENRLRASDGPTAVLAGGFYLALAVMQLARRAGRSIPTDLSLVGFDDPQSAPLLDPPLTTVRQPLGEMAAQAYRLICEAIANRRSVAGTACTLPTELVVRGSTGPVLHER